MMGGAFPLPDNRQLLKSLKDNARAAAKIGYMQLWPCEWLLAQMPVLAPMRQNPACAAGQKR